MKKTPVLRWLEGFALTLLCGVSAASPVPAGMELPDCATHYAEEYGLDLKLVQSIRIAEGGSVGSSVCANRNKTCDNGPMQINDGWFDGRWGVDLEKDYGVTKKSVVNNECVNLMVGMWRLRSEYESVKDWYEAVAAYNAGPKNRSAGYEYANRVFRLYERIKKHEGKAQGKEPIITPKKRQMVWISGA